LRLQYLIGAIGTVSAAIGILIYYLANHVDLQQRLRAPPSLLPDAIDYILRIHGPLAADRDGCIFEDPETFRLERESGAAGQL